MKVLRIAETKLNDFAIEETDYQFHQYQEADADELGEFAGRLCYLSWGRPNPKTATNRGYLENILNQGHYSVLEHSSVTYFITGVTRNFTHELIRHRHLSFSEVSQRYVDVSQFPFVEHPGIQELPKHQRDIIHEVADESKSYYDDIIDTLIRNAKKHKEARQAARHVLPGGLETQIVVTGNLRAWREVLHKRLSPTADAEFREVAKLVLADLKLVAPNTFQDMEVPE